MKKRIAIVMLPLLALSLASCMGDVSELYANNPYDTGNFLGNYYESWSDELMSDNLLATKSYEVSYYTSFAEFKSATPDFQEFSNSKGEALVWNMAGTNVSYSAPEGSDIFFGATKSLAYGEEGRQEFANGVVSKLFDGRVSCSGGQAKSRIQITENGFGSLLPLELSTYSSSYIALALRGATDCENGFGYGLDNSKRYTTIDLNLTFYVYNYSLSKYQPYTFKLKDLNLTTDNYNIPGVCESEGSSSIGYSDTHMISFYLDGVTGLEDKALTRASAFSFTYTLHDNLLDIPLSSNPQDSGNHYGLMLYEMMMPHSSWN